MKHFITLLFVLLCTPMWAADNYGCDSTTHKTELNVDVYDVPLTIYAPNGYRFIGSDTKWGKARILQYESMKGLPPLVAVFIKCKEEAWKIDQEIVNLININGWVTTHSKALKKYSTQKQFNSDMLKQLGDDDFVLKTLEKSKKITKDILLPREFGMPQLLHKSEKTIAYSLTAKQCNSIECWVNLTFMASAIRKGVVIFTYLEIPDFKKTLFSPKETLENLIISSGNTIKN